MKKIGPFAVTTAFLVAACSSSSVGTGSSAPASSDNSALGIAGQRPIGAPCTRMDGYEPNRGLTPAPGAMGPTTMVPKGLDLAHLPPGMGYCIPPGDVYPHGYFTMNCGVDGDCPGAAKCMIDICIAPCKVDSECAQPTHCAPTSKGYGFCSAPELGGRHGRQGGVPLPGTATAPPPPSANVRTPIRVP